MTCLRASTNRHQRAGAALVLALAVFTAVALLVGSSLGLFAAQHRALRQAQFEQQAWWLADAGLERAAAQLEENADYTGEVWQLAAEELTGVHPATVTIRVESTEVDAPLRRITAEAVYPADAPVTSRQRRTLLWQPISGGIP